MSTRADDHAFPLTINPGRGDEWVNGLAKREHFADALIAALNEEPQP